MGPCVGACWRECATLSPDASDLGGRVGKIECLGNENHSRLNREGRGQEKNKCIFKQKAKSNSSTKGKHFLIEACGGWAGMNLAEEVCLLVTEERGCHVLVCLCVQGTASKPAARGR